MEFLTIEELKPGMVLGKDLKYYDVELRQYVRLLKGHKMTEAFIDRMKASNITQLFVDTGSANKPPELRSIDKELQKEAVNDIMDFAESYKAKPMAITKTHINKIGEISQKLVDNIAREESCMVAISELKSYDEYTFHHSVSVAVLSISIGEALGFSQEELHAIGICGLLHDMGKVDIPIEIINKPSKLTPEEFEIIKKHPGQAGIKLMDNHLISKPIFDGIVCHHEKFNGFGYPRGLKGKKIPLFGRILAVADVYDALTSYRPYRKPDSPSDAFEYVMGGVDSHFDYDIVQAFLSKVVPYPEGSKVVLSNGNVAMVTQNNPLFPLRPIVCYQNSDIVDLSKDTDTYNIVISSLIS